jgi:methyl-accepting chemotaxis protein
MAYLFILIVIVILVILIIINIFIRRMVKPLDANVNLLGEIAETWNLTRRFEVSGSDEIGSLAENLNKTFGRIRDLVMIIIDRARELEETGEELSGQMINTSGSVAEITEATQIILKQTENQAAQVDKVDASMMNIIQLVEKLGGNITRQFENVSQSSYAIEEMFANIGMVADNLEKNSSNVQGLEKTSTINRKDLEAVSSEFQDITRQSEGLLEINAVIENIASQTNLLSMNAAIEAAHAGESGKGFAVVAGEIRKLAEDSSKQSKTIAEMLKKIKGGIDTITKSIAQVMQRFQEMDQKVKIIADQETMIRGAMEEQGTGNRQVLDAVIQLRELTGMVQKNTGEILQEGHTIINESASLKGITSEIERGMNEMASGTEHIKTTIHRVNEISRGNKNSIGTLMGEVMKFKIK